MNVSALEEYGLRCAVRLAQAYSNAEKPTLSASEIATQEGLSVEYVSKFMLHLKRANLVVAIRGVNGGFAISRDPREISLKDVFDALSGKRKFTEEFCSSYAGKSETCVRIDGCSIRPFWRILSLYVDEFTREMTLHDMLQSERETLLRTEEIARKNVEQMKMNKKELLRANKAEAGV